MILFNIRCVQWYILEKNIWAVPLYQGIITLFVIMNFSLATFMDPGVIPRGKCDPKVICKTVKPGSGISDREEYLGRVFSCLVCKAQCKYVVIMHAVTSRAENSAQFLSCLLELVLGWAELAEISVIVYKIDESCCCLLGSLSSVHWHLSNINCLMAHTACFVCFISTVNGPSKKKERKAKNVALVADT